MHLRITCLITLLGGSAASPSSSSRLREPGVLEFETATKGGHTFDTISAREESLGSAAASSNPDAALTIMSRAKTASSGYVTWPAATA
mmetsp:Transcript_11074/g.33120  ORF Transcript_11074/g.33120 Transcript_11074/m.33120 type:complete len:88 (+) Transcript_11074:1183-1446(+)